MLTSNSNSPAILEACQKRLRSVNSSSHENNIRFTALATAFLGANDQTTYGNVRVVGNELHSRKAALLYFLFRVAEKTGKTNTNNKVNDIILGFASNYHV